MASTERRDIRTGPFSSSPATTRAFVAAAIVAAITLASGSIAWQYSQASSNTVQIQHGSLPLPEAFARSQEYAPEQNSDSNRSPDQSSFADQAQNQNTNRAQSQGTSQTEAVDSSVLSRSVAQSSRPALAGFRPAASALDRIPTEKSLQSFSLANADAPVIEENELTAVSSAIDSAEETGDVGVVFYNLNTGAGISYNADEAIYGASSFKAPYALYVCETQIEEGRASLEDQCPSADAYDPASYYNGGSYPLFDLMEAAIVYSDNNAFGALRQAFDFEGYDEWALSLGLDDALYRDDSWFPWYSARSSAKVWTETYNYLQTESEAAQYLGELTGLTEVSFLRDALGSTGAQVQDKAGWCADYDPHFNGVCDAGIITMDGIPYIMCIMTGMPDSDESRALYANIATSVFAVRDALG